jgi:hypothetical protein
LRIGVVICGPEGRFMKRREFCGAINVNWLTHARACVLFSQPWKADPRQGGDSSDLVSQRGKEPKARSRSSFDENKTKNVPC